MSAVCVLTSVRATACGVARESHAKLTGQPTDPQVREQAAAVWNQVRESFPLHVQALFRSQMPSGYTAVVITEPPPHATLHEIGKRIGASAVSVQLRKVRYDGWANKEDCNLLIGTRDATPTSTAN